MFRKWFQMVFSMNVFKNKKNVGKIKTVKKRKKNVPWIKNVKKGFFTSMTRSTNLLVYCIYSGRFFSDFSLSSRSGVGSRRRAKFWTYRCSEGGLGSYGFDNPALWQYFCIAGAIPLDDFKEISTIYIWPQATTTLAIFIAFGAQKKQTVRKMRKKRKKEGIACGRMTAENLFMTYNNF